MNQKKFKKIKDYTRINFLEDKVRYIHVGENHVEFVEKHIAKKSKKGHYVLTETRGYMLKALSFRKAKRMVKQFLNV